MVFGLVVCIFLMSSILFPYQSEDLVATGLRLVIERLCKSITPLYSQAFFSLERTAVV